MYGVYHGSGPALSGVSVASAVADRGFSRVACRMSAPGETGDV